MTFKKSITKARRKQRRYQKTRGENVGIFVEFRFILPRNSPWKRVIFITELFLIPRDRNNVIPLLLSIFSTSRSSSTAVRFRFIAVVSIFPQMLRTRFAIRGSGYAKFFPTFSAIRLRSVFFPSFAGGKFARSDAREIEFRLRGVQDSSYSFEIYNFRGYGNCRFNWEFRILETGTFSLITPDKVLEVFIFKWKCIRCYFMQKRNESQVYYTYLYRIILKQCIRIILWIYVYLKIVSQQE